MAFRDQDVIFKERIEQLELSLARSAGRVILLTEERDALRDQLERLTGDPKALARVRKQKGRQASLYSALRVLGGLVLLFALLPMLALVVTFLASGEPGMAVACASVPALIVYGVLAMKMPEIVQALELRFERKRHDRRAADLGRTPARVRVEASEPEELHVSAGGERKNERFGR